MGREHLCFVVSPPIMFRLYFLLYVFECVNALDLTIRSSVL